MLIFAPLNNEPIPLLQQVEVATFFQLPSFQIIGLPSPEVAEARERIRSAFEVCGLNFPKKRVVVNLSPASVRKQGTGLDLAMALAILFRESTFKLRWGAWGELGLDGTVKPVGQMTRALFSAWQGKLTDFILSHRDYEVGLKALNCIAASGTCSGDPPFLIPVVSLLDAWSILSGERTNPRKNPLESKLFLNEIDSESEKIGLSCLALSPALERVVSIAALGNHHLLLLGPRGVGKSHALEWLVALRPPVSASEQLQHQLLIELGHPMRGQGPFVVRRVGSQVRPGALVGGVTSSSLRPGEFSLAHGGLLIADELPEWPRDSRESLREPLERGKITLTRAQGAWELPARFQLAANGNICPCGGAPGESEKGGEISECSCSEFSKKSYRSRISGPILDRIDLVFFMNSSLKKMEHKQKNPAGIKKLKEQVEKALCLSKSIWGKQPGMLSAREIESWMELHPEWELWLPDCCRFSLRSRHKVVQVAMSLSLWDGETTLKESHFIEAGYYRPDRYFNLLRQNSPS